MKSNLADSDSCKSHQNKWKSLNVKNTEGPNWKSSIDANWSDLFLLRLGTKYNKKGAICKLNIDWVENLCLRIGPNQPVNCGLT